MTVYIINSQIRERDYDGIVLCEKDFHPCHPFFIEHPDIQPETINRIVIKGILERSPYLRAVLRYCDYMLAKNGIIEIYYYNIHFETSLYVRARNEWQYELSLVFGSRIILTEQHKDDEKGFFIYKKIDCFLPSGDTIDKWSFGIVSSGRLNNKVMDMIFQIKALNIPHYEVIICGPAPAEILPSFVRVLDDSHLYPDIRIPISKKKNYIIEESKYNNIVLIHDRYTIPQFWYDNMRKYGNYFDLMGCNVLDDEQHKYSMPSWGWHEHYPFPYTIRDVIFKKAGWLKKNSWNNSTYIPGGFFIFKKHFGLRLNPYCNWGEMEDVDFCHRGYNMGMLLTYDPNNSVYCTTVRFGKGFYNKSSIRKTLGRIKALFGYLSERNKFSKYLKSLHPRIKTNKYN